MNYTFFDPQDILVSDTLPRYKLRSARSRSGILPDMARGFCGQSIALEARPL